MNIRCAASAFTRFGLVRIVRAGITGITNAVLISIRLIRVRSIDTVVVRVEHAVLININILKDPFGWRDWERLKSWYDSYEAQQIMEGPEYDQVFASPQGEERTRTLAEWWGTEENPPEGMYPWLTYVFRGELERGRLRPLAFDERMTRARYRDLRAQAQRFYDREGPYDQASSS